ncbi:MAG: hypothetical protein WBZ29_17965 [Methanocella sp.]
MQFITLLAVFSSSAAAADGAYPGHFVAISAGSSHTLGLKDDGTVWACGSDYYGECGIAPEVVQNSSYIRPWTKMDGLTSVMAISAGGSLSMALKSDGTVWTWGIGNMLGDGTSDEHAHPVPVQVPGLSWIKAIAAGQNYAFALKEDGTVMGWGDNTNGLLGNGMPIGLHKAVWPTYYSYIPVQVNGLSGITHIAATMGNPVALKSDGTVWTWGYIPSVKVADNVLPPSEIVGISNAIDVAGGNYHIDILKDDGTVWTVSGDIQYCLPGATERPMQVAELREIADISAIDEHTLARSKDGSIWAWGQNYYGQLGDGTEKDRSSPVKVPLSDIAVISAGMHFSIAVSGDGTVWAWGNDQSGQLGDGDHEEVPVGSRFDKTTPVKVIAGTSSSAQNNSSTSDSTIKPDITPSPSPGFGLAETSIILAVTVTFASIRFSQRKRS